MYNKMKKMIQWLSVFFSKIPIANKRKCKTQSPGKVTLNRIHDKNLFYLTAPNMKSKLLISLLFLCLFNVDVALGQISIMPVGDSITFGTWDSESRPSEVITGYRQPLYLMLQQAGFDIDFVGGMNSDYWTD